jgi:hypothetical protein
MVINSGAPPQQIGELLRWQKSAAFDQKFNSASNAGKMMGSYLGGDLPLSIFNGVKSTYLLKKNDKAKIHVSAEGAVLISVSSPIPSIVFMGNLSESNVSVESTIELEKKLRRGKAAGIAATAVFILPEVALLGLIGGVRKQVNKETYILQVGTPTSGGAFLIGDEHEGRAIARLKAQSTREVATVAIAPSTRDRLNELQTLLDDGLISVDEFAAKRAGIIAEI